MTILIGIIMVIAQLLTWAILIDALLSWVPQYNETVYKIRRFLNKFTEPVTNPVRKLISPLTNRIMIDFTPVVAIIVIEIVRNLLVRLLMRL